jgi:hypothetical protein
MASTCVFIVALGCAAAAFVFATLPVLWAALVTVALAAATVRLVRNAQGGKM